MNRMVIQGARYDFLVIGSAGMAGHMIYTFLKEQGFSVFGMDIRSNHFSVDQVVDMSDFDLLRQALIAHPAAYVINCAAILGKPMVDNPDLAYRVNSLMPHVMAEALATIHSHLFHISSDFVFSGNRKGGGYLENDEPDNETPYGLYKRQGEVRAVNATNIRLSIIGPTPCAIIPNYLNNVIASTASSLWGLTNAYWTGVTTLELAKSIVELSQLERAPSIAHLCSKKKETRFASIEAIKSVFGISKLLESRLGDEKDYSLCSNVLPYRKSLFDQLVELRHWMIDHPQLYGEYECLK